MSDTPRTDEAMLRADDIECGGTFDAVHVQVSRRLERELIKVTQERDSLKVQLAEAQQHRDEWSEVYTQTLKKLGDAREQIAKLITDA